MTQAHLGGRYSAHYAQFPLNQDNVDAEAKCAPSVQPRELKPAPAQQPARGRGPQAGRQRPKHGDDPVLLRVTAKRVPPHGGTLLSGRE